MIYRLHCHSIVGCEESPVTAVGAAGLPAGSFVSATGICIFDIRPRRFSLRNFNNILACKYLFPNFNTLIFNIRKTEAFALNTSNSYFASEINRKVEINMRNLYAD